jgi:predicted lipid-binding transport protein (Tim44 family)
MGWASGSQLMSEVIAAIADKMDDHDTKVEIFESIIEAFEDADCDTLQECLDEDDAFDEALKNIHPDWFDEDYE